MKSVEEAANFLRLYERLENVSVRLAFFALVQSLANETDLTLRPLRRGNFSAVHLLFDPLGTTYGDAEFAFKGAKDHLRWWFRTPCLTKGLLFREEIEQQLVLIDSRQDEELVSDLRTVEDVDRLFQLIAMAGERFSRFSPKKRTA